MSKFRIQTQRFRRDDESGLTTLEWLLIVAAVAGLAALAVVLVQNVVDDTAEQISGSSARETAAKVAAAEVTQKATDAGSVLGASGSAANLTQWNTLENEYRNECSRLEITYGDIPNLSADWNHTPATTLAQASATTANWLTALDNNSGTAGTPASVNDDSGCTIN